MDSVKLCPRCGQQEFGIHLKNRQRYPYFGYKVRKGEKWGIRWCYLGNMLPNVGNKLGKMTEGNTPKQTASHTEFDGGPGRVRTGDHRLVKAISYH